MSRIAEWLVAGVALVAGVLLAGFAMALTGLSLYWEGYGATAEETRRPWWLWLVFLLPPVLMLAAGFLVRRTGASWPVSLGAAGLTGVLVGLAYLVTIYVAR